MSRLPVLFAFVALLAAGSARADSDGRCRRTEPLGSFSYACDAASEQPFTKRTESLGSFSYASDPKVNGPLCTRSEPMGSFGYACDATKSPASESREATQVVKR